MLQTRLIPCLLLKHQGLVKTKKFKKPVYLGDPINIIKIFNDKGVDELVFLDITATPENSGIPLKLLKEISSECFMPFAYGGGIRTVDEIRQILKIGVEKVIINTRAVEDPDLIKAAAEKFGSQSIVVSIDVRQSWFGKYRVYTYGGRKSTRLDVVEHARHMQQMGAGEIFLNSVDRDGTMSGYDLTIIKKVAAAISIPLVACGGAGKIEDFKKAVKEGGASAVAAGSMLVFHGPHRAVLINVPAAEEFERQME